MEAPRRTAQKGTAEMKPHLLRRRLTDLLDHAEALEEDVRRLLKVHEQAPHEAATLHEIVQLGAALADIQRSIRLHANNRGYDPAMPMPQLRECLRQDPDRRRMQPGQTYDGRERRRRGRRSSDQ
ncbi:MAG TPA: hypothetical protein VF157_15580 [Chloroflexota bacterium]